MWHGGALSARTTASAHNASLCVLPFTSETAPFETFFESQRHFFCSLECSALQMFSS